MVDDSNINQHASAKPGAYLRLSVSDNGSGMDEQTRSHIFEPFFTTKAVGKGTGLGLSTVYAIVNQLGGWVDVQSELGIGSTFEVYFPAVASTASGLNSGMPFPNSEQKKTELGGNERVLLVEDDDQIRSFLTSLLTRFGYKVTAAPDGPSAIDAMDDAPEPFALLLTDMVMPNGITGAGLAAIARAKCPSLKVVFMSGYSPELLAAQGQMIDRSALIIKPVTHSKLLSTLREHLGGSTSSSLA
jgi:CheY-like chemotaxis protein